MNRPNKSLEPTADGPQGSTSAGNVNPRSGSAPSRSAKPKKRKRFIKKILWFIGILVLTLAWFWWTLAHTGELAAHNLNGAHGNTVWTSPDGHSEAVFDSSEKPVTDPANKPSYNYGDPRRQPFKHFFFDTFPWLLWGNAGNDPTTFSDRLGAFWSDYLDGVRRAFSVSGNLVYQNMEEQYQHNADMFRVKHLIEWAEIIEAYHENIGHYPLQDRAETDKPVLVQIATREQQVYLDSSNPKYKKDLDNKSSRFTAVSVKDFVSEIERVLERDIDERYDPQRVPNGAPIHLSYFASNDGYLIYTIGRTCPPTANTFSTLVLPSAVPSINIGSAWFIENIPKVQSIESLKANKQFKEFVSKGPTRPGWYEQLEREQVDESKK